MGHKFLLPEKQYELLSFGAVDCINRKEFLEKFKENRPFRIKAGFDPSRPDIHLGHLLVIGKLREFQDLGHRVIFIVGDWTARIGDPSGQNKTRPQLSKEESQKNAKTYLAQATKKNFKVSESADKKTFCLHKRLKRLDPEKTECVFNSTWLEKLSLGKFINDVCSHMTLARTLERNDFSERYKQNKPIGLHEFLYPVLQAYDSLELKADVEIGGTDQLFNFLLGRQLQKDFGFASQCVLTFPLLEGLDGAQKMSKSLGNAISFQDAPTDIFGKVMNLSDELMIRYWEKLAGTDASYRASVEDKTLHPKKEKELLAHSLVSVFYGLEAADQAQAEFKKIFSERKLPKDIPEKSIKAKKDVWICALVKELGLFTSTSAARRSIEGGGLQWDGEKLMDPKEHRNLSKGESFTLRSGRRAFLKVHVI